MKKIFLLVVFLFTFIVFAPASRTAQPEEAVSGSGTAYIFVHGLSGWGRYDTAYRFMPYWGMFGGDLMKYLNEQGYASYAASVSPEGSAWDRACELYAQLTGTVVDYGKEHCERCGHERFGRDFSEDPLIPDWDSGRKIVLLGHSFGGATVRLFSELLANGSAEEREVTPAEDLSSLFAGGQGDRILALVTLAAPTNGTTAYDLFEDPDFDVSQVEISAQDSQMGNLFNARPQAENDGRSEEDMAAYDMHIDNALALNARISTLPETYYFAVPCIATEMSADGTQQPEVSIMEGLFRRTSTLMGSYTGTTAGGFVIDESWQENDGLVNTVSAMAPIGAPSAPFDPENMEPGIWYIMPTYHGDHMSLQGGMSKWNNIRPFYLELIGMIDRLSPEFKKQLSEKQ